MRCTRQRNTYSPIVWGTHMLQCIDSRLKKKSSLHCSYHCPLMICIAVAACSPDAVACPPARSPSGSIASAAWPLATHLLAPGPRPPALLRCGGGSLLTQWSPVRSLAQRRHGWHISLAQGRWLGAAMTTCSHHACAWHEERKGNAIDLPSLLQGTDRRI